MVRCGDMDHQIKVHQGTSTDDGQGGRTTVYASVATVWGNIIPLSVGRAQSLGMTVNNKPHEIDLRWESGLYTLTEDDKLEVVETGQILYVHSVINTDKRYERAKVVAVEKQ